MLHKLTSELLGNTVIFLLVSPGIARPQEAVIHTFHMSRDFEVEALVMAHLRLLDGAVEDAINAGTSDRDIHTLTNSVTTTSPTGVEEVDLGAMAVELLTKELGVDDGVHGHEGATEAGGEVGDGLLDTTLSTGDLGGVTAEEVVHGLLSGELGDGGEDTVGIAGEEDDGLGVTSHAVLLVVGDVVDGVGHTTVLGLGDIVVVQRVVGLHHDVLEEGVTLDGVPNIGLLFLGEVDGLGVAAALEVEDTIVVPAVLIITNQETLGVGGEGGLTGTGETEEQGGVTVLTDIGGAVHGENALERKAVVHHTEDTLLHLTTVLGTDDESQAVLEIETDEGFRVEALLLPVLVDKALAGVDHGEGGLEVLELFSSGADEHVGDEVVLPGVFSDETDGHAGLGVGTAETIEDVNSLVLHVFLDIAVNFIEDLFRNGLVRRNGTPPDVALGGFSLDEVLVLRRSTGVNTSVDFEGTSLGEDTFVVVLFVFSNFVYK